jgi:hypothetical protein
VNLDGVTINPKLVRWIRPEYKDKWELLVPRKTIATIIGVPLDSLSSTSKRYRDIFPGHVATAGRLTIYVKSEVEEFAARLRTMREEAKGGNRSARTQRSLLDVAKSNLAHTEERLARIRSQRESRLKKVEAIRERISVLDQEEKAELHSLSILKERIAAIEMGSTGE